MADSKLGLVILTGRDVETMCFASESLVVLFNAEILSNRERPSFRRRLRSLRWKIRREGKTCIWSRINEVICDDFDSWAKRSGYAATFSAYGGYVDGQADLFDIRRIGVSGQHRPLDLVMGIAGISVGASKYR